MCTVSAKYEKNVTFSFLSHIIMSVGVLISLIFHVLVNYFIINSCSFA
jgi:hypothetical protein